MDESTDQPPGVVYPGYELRDHLQPRVNVDGLNSLHQGFVDFREMAVVKPQRQKSERESEREREREGVCVCV